MSHLSRAAQGPVSARFGISVFFGRGEGELIRDIIVPKEGWSLSRLSLRY